LLKWQSILRISSRSTHHQCGGQHYVLCTGRDANERERNMSHSHEFDPTKLWSEDFWNERYGSANRIWSGNPNPQLVTHATELPVGTALDVGCGEGADAIWLAARGWQVTGTDVSTVALGRAAEQAAELGAEVAGRIVWQQADMLAWTPPPRQFDLVSAQFIHPPVDVRDALHRQLAAAVRPGGTLLIVGHHPSDLETTIGRPNLPDLLFTAEEVAAALPPDDWDLVVVAAPARQTTDPVGQPVTIHDAVLKAVRRR
jgi:SAM-dependent methyltransferase